MTQLQNAIEDYITLRQTLGFKLRKAATGLRRFGVFLEANGATFITIKLAREWAMQPAQCQPSVWAQRLGWILGWVQI